MCQDTEAGEPAGEAAANAVRNRLVESGDPSLSKTDQKNGNKADPERDEEYRDRHANAILQGVLRLNDNSRDSGDICMPD